MAFRCGVHIILFIVFLSFPTTLSDLINDPRWAEVNHYNKKPNCTTDLVIPVDSISQALWDNGNYRIMSLILKTTLHDVFAVDDVITGTNDTNNSTITLKNHDKITIYVPQDVAVHFRREVRWSKPHVRYQVMPFRVEQNMFDSGVLTIGDGLGSFGDYELVVSASDAINYVQIIDWNIFDDGHVIVHGVDSFFNPQCNIRKPEMITLSCGMPWW